MTELPAWARPQDMTPRAPYVAPEKVRDGMNWVWVVTRICENGHNVRIRAGRTTTSRRVAPGSWKSSPRAPELPPGAIRCPVCEALVRF